MKNYSWLLILLFGFLLGFIFFEIVSNNGRRKFPLSEVLSEEDIKLISGGVCQERWTEKKSVAYHINSYLYCVPSEAVSEPDFWLAPEEKKLNPPFSHLRLSSNTDNSFDLSVASPGTEQVAIIDIGDGKFEKFTFFNNKTKTHFIDYGLDGTYDVKLEENTGTINLKLNGKWYPVEVLGSRKFIVVEDKLISVQFKDGKYFLVDEM